MEVDSPNTQDFLEWFKNAGASLSDSVGIIQFPGMSRGAVALQDIAKDSTLFTIPRTALLSTQTSSLRKVLGEADWKALGSGWQPLIVSIMWEESRGDASPWAGYLRDLPTAFDTLMFWNEQELEALQASTIREKIGKSDVEKGYHEQVLPLLQRRPDVFDPSLLNQFFTLERYHINGSRILSRSFNVEESSPDDQDEETEDQEIHENSADMDLSEEPNGAIDAPLEDLVQEGDGESDNEEDDDDVEGVSMVPMADILNARQGCNNAKLFYEKFHLRMDAIKDIKAGEQIWNTYGDPPNSELLRRYGYVDFIPCDKPGYNFPFENPEDDVEIRADLILDICAPSIQGEARVQKIDVWLTLGGDDTFVINNEDQLCKPMFGLIQYLSMSQAEIDDAISKDKLPKGKATGTILADAVKVYRTRLAQYTTSVEEDEIFLKDFTGTPDRVYNATFVRLGEKRLLEHAIAKGEAILQAESSSKAKAKRGRDQGVDAARGKKKAKR